MVKNTKDNSKTIKDTAGADSLLAMAEYMKATGVKVNKMERDFILIIRESKRGGNGKMENALSGLMIELLLILTL